LDEPLQLDAILISHAHADHLDPPSLRRVARGCPVIAPGGCLRTLRSARIGPAIELAAGERCRVGAIEVEGMPALHDGRRLPLGRRTSALGFLIHGPVRVYFAGDTGLFEGMAALAGRVDVALLPVWGWGPRLPAGHLDPASAARAAALIRPSVAVPIHWGTMRAVGARHRGDAETPALAFAAAVADLAPSTDVRILAPGEAMELDARCARHCRPAAGE
jgi:L-ascorbate metabolism protein UlaG (beta-lactamase superfamily)